MKMKMVPRRLTMTKKKKKKIITIIIQINEIRTRKTVKAIKMTMVMKKIMPIAIA